MTIPPISIGIMIESQEGLNWPRFFRLADAVEELGFESLFRSDHLTALAGPAEAGRRETLPLWPSLTALALRTRRLRFGPLVCSMTFRQPALLARAAASVDVLSGGRLDLGLGAGWNRGEHRMFGIPFPPYAQRLEMLDEGARVIRALWRSGPADYTGKYYRLEDAVSLPLPVQQPTPLIMGGSGERTLKIVAEHASEWNSSYASLDVFKAKSRALDDNCRAIGRDPGSLRRSAMVPFVLGQGAKAIQARIDGQRATFPSLPADLEGWRAKGFPGGTPAELVAQLKEWAEAGCMRIMLQHNDLDDLASLTLLAAEVLPHLPAEAAS
jgi:F420-dependent oxidoreductase-like protein